MWSIVKLTVWRAGKRQKWVIVDLEVEEIGKPDKRIKTWENEPHRGFGFKALKVKAWAGITLLTAFNPVYSFKIFFIFFYFTEKVINSDLWMENTKIHHSLSQLSVIIIY